MARKPFVVIDAEILSSSIWSESATTKLVWLTLLILCDTDGYVGAALPGIAHAAGVTREECEEALAILQQPDPDSRTQSHDGRRLERVERGWLVLNFREHLDRLSRERAKSRDRVRKHRARRNAGNAPKADMSTDVTTGNREQGKGTREQTSTDSINQPRAREGYTPKANPFIAQGERPKWETEALTLTGEIARLMDMDGAEVFQKASGYSGARTSKINPANLTEDRLVNTVLDLRKMLKQARERVIDRESRGSL